ATATSFVPIPRMPGPGSTQRLSGQGLPEGTSKNRSTPLSFDECNRRPSAENTRERNGLVPALRGICSYRSCPLLRRNRDSATPQRRNNSPDSASQTRSVPSSPPVASKLPSHDSASAEMPPVGPFSAGNSSRANRPFRSITRHRLTSPLMPPV